MNTFFDESGLLNIDDLILEQPSFKTIMADGIVTEEELNEQSKRIIDLLIAIEKNASPEMIEKISELLAEISVLIAARSIFNKQQAPIQ